MKEDDHTLILESTQVNGHGSPVKSYYAQALVIVGIKENKFGKVIWLTEDPKAEGSDEWILADVPLS